MFRAGCGLLFVQTRICLGSEFPIAELKNRMVLCSNPPRRHPHKTLRLPEASYPMRFGGNEWPPRGHWALGGAHAANLTIAQEDASNLAAKPLEKGTRQTQVVIVIPFLVKWVGRMSLDLKRGHWGTDTRCKRMGGPMGPMDPPPHKFPNCNVMQKRPRNE